MPALMAGSSTGVRVPVWMAAMAGLRPAAGGDGSCRRGVGELAVSAATARMAREELSPAEATGIAASAFASVTGFCVAATGLAATMVGTWRSARAAGRGSGVARAAAGGLRSSVSSSAVAATTGSAGRCRTTGAGRRLLCAGCDGSSPWIKGEGSRSVGAVLGIWLSASAASSAAVVWRLFCSAAERMVKRCAAAALSKSAAVALGAEVARSGVRVGSGAGAGCGLRAGFGGAACAVAIGTGAVSWVLYQAWTRSRVLRSAVGSAAVSSAATSAVLRGMWRAATAGPRACSGGAAASSLPVRVSRRPCTGAASFALVSRPCFFPGAVSTSASAGATREVCRASTWVCCLPACAGFAAAVRPCVSACANRTGGAPRRTGATAWWTDAVAGGANGNSTAATASRRAAGVLKLESAGIWEYGREEANIRASLG